MTHSCAFGPVVSSETSHFLGVLANPARLLILLLLCEGEYCVGEIEGMTEVRQPSLSQQLTVLRKERLVSTRREGRLVYYRLASGHLRRMILAICRRAAPAKISAE